MATARRRSVSAQLEAYSAFHSSRFRVGYTSMQSQSQGRERRDRTRIPWELSVAAGWSIGTVIPSNWISKLLWKELRQNGLLGGEGSVWGNSFRIIK